MTNQNGNSVNYVFIVFNDGGLGANTKVQDFTVNYFNPTTFNETTLVATATPAGWIL